MASKADEPSETVAIVTAPAGAIGNKLVYVLLAVQLLLVAAIVVLFLRPPVGANADTEAAVEEIIEEEPVGEIEPPGPPIYFVMDPAFTVNLQDEKRVRFLQLNVQLLTRSEVTESAIALNEPMLRNNLLMLFSAQRAEDIATVEGKERLRSAALEEVRKVLDENFAPADVEAVFFTSFVVQ